MLRSVLAAAAVAALLNAPAALAAAPAPPDGPQAYFAVPVTSNPSAEPVSRPAEYDGPMLNLRWTHIGDRAAEPTMGIDRSGTLFYAGRGVRNPAGVRGTKLFRSRDDGHTWERIDVFTGVPGEPVPDLDPWVYVDTDSGRVFNISLDGAGSYITLSDDQGESWTPSHASSPGFNDHQAMTSGPPPEASPLLTPLDPAFPEILYYCVNHVTDARCAASRDGGVTFLPSGAPATLACGSGLHGHAQTDHEGRLFLPFGDCESPQLAVSEDGGMSWEVSDVAPPDLRAGTPHTEVAVDRVGNVYYTWFDAKHHQAYLATSTDHGKTWSPPLLISPPTVHETNFPTIVAGEPGRVAITFPGTTADAQGGDGQREEDGTRPWSQYVIVSTNALDAQPLFLSNVANPPDDPIHRGACTGRCGGPLDFLDIQLSPYDGAFWVAAVDGCTGDCVRNPEAPADDNQGYAIKQESGPRLVGPLEPTPPARPGAPLPPGGVVGPDRSAPRIRGLKARRRGRQTRLRFTLSEAATVTVRVDRRRGKRWRRAGRFVSSAANGANDLPVRRVMRRGRYRITLVAVDASGNRSRPARAGLRIRR